MGSSFACGDLIGGDGAGCLIDRRGGAAHAEKVLDDSAALKGGSDC